MLDKDLFYSLCEKYGVELTDKYGRAVIKTDDGVLDICECNVRDLFFKGTIQGLQEAAVMENEQEIQ